ncbi:MAG TPA: phage integrase SAM-like domain and Arm DNA-binding domain-containing protein, partial [Flavipsychrobacter sp.]
MSITFKFLLNKRRANSQGEYPIVVRIFKDRLYKEYSLPYRVKEIHWDDKAQTILSGTPEREEITTAITSIRNKIRKHLLLAELDNSISISPQDIVDSLKGKKEDNTPKHRSTSIITYTRNYIQTLTQNGKVGNAMVYTCAINKLRAFVKTDNFSFEALTYKKLDEFHNYLVSEKVKMNTISVYMRTVRAVYNRAIKEGIVPVTSYPFTGYRVKNEKTPNRTLTVSEMQSIINL